ncbi:uncharacterized protein LOC142771534 isoform X1 [Rhipicephalus microplus]|uniref:uncharacterized protein LOC142771534 isoform X1 n=1 Tax=Rhipicephalus microplus TaxID=6941 RepID=UPI003F6BA44A
MLLVSGYEVMTPRTSADVGTGSFLNICGRSFADIGVLPLPATMAQITSARETTDVSSSRQCIVRSYSLIRVGAKEIAPDCFSSTRLFHRKAAHSSGTSLQHVLS